MDVVCEYIYCIFYILYALYYIVTNDYYFSKPLWILPRSLMTFPSPLLVLYGHHRDDWHFLADIEISQQLKFDDYFEEGD
jgi:hypothetical protein